MYFCDRKDFQIKHQETIIHLTWTERKTVTHTKLHININHKTANDIVKVALEQVGNVGGQPFWSCYGFGSRVDWCACFASWCANQNVDI